MPINPTSKLATRTLHSSAMCMIGQGWVVLIAGAGFRFNGGSRVGRWGRGNTDGQLQRSLGGRPHSLPTGPESPSRQRISLGAEWWGRQSRGASVGACMHALEVGPAREEFVSGCAGPESSARTLDPHPRLEFGHCSLGDSTP
jgi:hypothetical protein